MNKQYLSAAEAAAELGIQVSTLYAYVSRGLIRSEEAGGKSRARRYLAADVAALRARKALRREPEKAAAATLYFGPPVLESGMTLIENGRFHYRGHDALTLAAERSFATVAGLLWLGNLESDPLAGAAPIALPPLDLSGLTPIEAFQTALPLAAARDLAAYDLSPTAVSQTGGRIVQTLTAVFASQPTNSPTDQPIPTRLAHVLAPHCPPAADLLNAALILCADHELNISAFTARCVASAGGTPYGVVLAGLAALQGVKHGGQTERVDALFREVGEPERAATAVASRLRRGEGVPGFGHPLYPEGDPRGRFLLDWVEEACGEETAVALARGVETAVWQAIGQRPTLDFGLVTLARALGLPSGAALGLFALGRAVGWIGHALEQYQDGQSIRPRARYVGPMRKS